MDMIDGIDHSTGVCHGAEASALLRRAGRLPELHARGGARARDPVDPVAPDPPARGRARPAAVRPHRQEGGDHRGRRAAARLRGARAAGGGPGRGAAQARRRQPHRQGAHRRHAHLQHRPDPGMRGAVPRAPSDRAHQRRGARGRRDRARGCATASWTSASPTGRSDADRPVVRAALQRGDGAGGLARSHPLAAPQAHPHGRAAPAATWCCCPRTSRPAPCSTSASSACGAEPIVVAEMSTIAPMLGAGGAHA